MSDRMRLTGMYSGMDTESIVQQLVAAKQTKVDTLKNDQKKLEWKQTAWQDLNSKIYSLYSKTLSNIRFSAAYKTKSTKSSDPTKATVVAGDGAVNGTQTLKINKLAKSGYLTGAKLPDHYETVDGVNKKVGFTSSSKLSDIDKSLVGSKISITVGKGDEAKTTEIEMTEDMTVNQFNAKLKEAGVNASFDEGNQRFFISSTDSGEANEFTLTDNTGSNAALKALGIDESATYANGSTCTRIKAQDAEIVLNDAVFTSNTNTFNINGLTITATGLTAEDEEISLVTTTDHQAVYDTIKEFLSEYNDLINEMDKLYNADSARKFNMLSEEEKEAMSEEEVEKWEGTIKGALLRKDTQLSSVMNAMTETMLAGCEVNGKKMYLSDFGIGTLGYFKAKDNEHHAYHIDGDADDEDTSANDDKLMKAITENPEETAEFFAGLCKNLYNSLDKLMSTTTDYSSVYKVYNDKQLKKDYDSYTKKIKEAEEKLSDYEDKWYDKFTAMETALAKLQSNQSAVSGMLGMN